MCCYILSIILALMVGIGVGFVAGIANSWSTFYDRLGEVMPAARDIPKKPFGEFWQKLADVCRK